MTVEGYEVTGRKRVLDVRDGADHLFVWRGTMPGRPWLRFQRKLDGPGYWVSAHRTLADAKENR